jgi:hypothetical protein
MGLVTPRVGDPARQATPVNLRAARLPFAEGTPTPSNDETRQRWLWASSQNRVPSRSPHGICQGLADLAGCKPSCSPERHRQRVWARLVRRLRPEWACARAPPCRRSALLWADRRRGSGAPSPGARERPAAGRTGDAAAPTSAQSLGLTRLPTLERISLAQIKFARMA